MDTLSTTHPVSSLLPKPFLLTNTANLHHLLKPPTVPISNTNAASLSAKPNTLSHAAKPLTGPTAPHVPSTRHPVVNFTVQSHCKAATGYAAALLDVAACDGVLGAVARDVRRFMRAVLTVSEVEEGVKGEVVTKVAEGGRFYGKLVVLVRMLVRKGKVGLVGEVMEEFGRLWLELQVGIKSRGLIHDLHRVRQQSTEIHQIIMLEIKEKFRLRYSVGLIG